MRAPLPSPLRCCWQLSVEPRRVSVATFKFTWVSDENETINNLLPPPDRYPASPPSNYRLRFECSILDNDWLQRYRVPSDPRHLFFISLPAARLRGRFLNSIN